MNTGQRAVQGPFSPVPKVVDTFARVIQSGKPKPRR